MATQTETVLAGVTSIGQDLNHFPETGVIMHYQPTLAELITLGEHRQVRPTMAGAHLAKVTDRQHVALHIAATAARVERGGKPGQVPVGVLTALARKGCLRLVAHPGTRRTNWAYGVITATGRAELARLDAAHAAEVRMQHLRDGQPVAA